MKHKHADLIHAWADGAQIQWLDSNCDWCNIACTPSWSIETTYRIKPEPKPDYVRFARAHIISRTYKEIGDNIALTFDGETGELKSAEVI